MTFAPNKTIHYNRDIIFFLNSETHFGNHFNQHQK